ncbi:membrane protein [Candidatus Omnitrophus magneticus]|uniref:Membrane protein n=1 Tax=Candidatus Omnitrophus magneticus TaxID=1609969 RepID=A0A0F0CMW6_9BACT|nr:membrane protein [Candidatus Omnitrophus magneticus]
MSTPSNSNPVSSPIPESIIGQSSKNFPLILTPFNIGMVILPRPVIIFLAESCSPLEIKSRIVEYTLINISGNSFIKIIIISLFVRVSALYSNNFLSTLSISKGCSIKYSAKELPNILSPNNRCKALFLSNNKAKLFIISLAFSIFIFFFIIHGNI